MTIPGLPPVDDLFQGTGLRTLGQNPPGDAVVACLHRLRELMGCLQDEGRHMEVPLLRSWAIDALQEAGIRSPAKVVDGALNPGKSEAERSEGGPGQTLALSDPEPWADPVDGGDILVELVKVFSRYLALPDGAPTALALWTLHAHAHDAAVISPILGITSPQKRCGKTTALCLLGGLVPRPLPASNITAPALFRSVERWAPTLLVDEADSFLKDREDLRGILNCGHNRAGAYVIRTVGDDHEAKILTTWAPKAVALIGRLPDTLADRSIEISMRRRGAGEKVDRLRLDQLADLEPLRRKAWSWAQDHIEELKVMDPSMPTGLHDRAADNWRSLLAIADTIGGVWPERARKAATLLSGQTEDDEAGTLLLADIQNTFSARAVDRLTSTDLVGILVKMEDRPWPEWSRGNALTARGLAKILKPYKIRPRPLTWGGIHSDGTRGYEAPDFKEAWERYLPADSTPPQVQGPQGAYSPNGYSDSHKCKHSPPLADTEIGETPTATTDLALLAIRKGVPGKDAPFSEWPRKFSKITADLFEEVTP